VVGIDRMPGLCAAERGNQAGRGAVADAESDIRGLI
jgi:hypothetical protein